MSLELGTKVTITNSHVHLGEKGTIIELSFAKEWVYHVLLNSGEVHLFFEDQLVVDSLFKEKASFETIKPVTKPITYNQAVKIVKSNMKLSGHEVDGRKRAYSIPPRQPLDLRNSSVQIAIAGFLKTGYSPHSGNASLLQYIIDYCEENLISYVIRAVPRKGYDITRIEEPTT